MSWEQLSSILDERRDTLIDDRQSPPTACPNDGTPLNSDASGGLHCPYDGYRWPRDGKL